MVCITAQLTIPLSTTEFCVENEIFLSEKSDMENVLFSVLEIDPKPAFFFPLTKFGVWFCAQIASVF